MAFVINTNAQSGNKQNEGELLLQDSKYDFINIRGLYEECSCCKKTENWKKIEMAPGSKNIPTF